MKLRKIVVTLALTSMLLANVTAGTIKAQESRANSTASESVSPETEKTKESSLEDEKNKKGIDVNEYIGESAFIGSSIGIGQRMYFNRQGKGFLGNPTMLVVGCYSFYNDTRTSGQITYTAPDGTEVTDMAKNLIKLSGVKRVFVNMGTNDIYMGAKKTSEKYKEYLKGIREENPEVVIFVESMTYATKSTYTNGKKYFSDASVDEYNSIMEQYCQENKDMYYIDVTSQMKAAEGGLAAKYCSDGYVHISFEGYRVWTDKLVSYVENLINTENKAKEAVDKYLKKGTDGYYRWAAQKVDLLKDSTVKDALLAKLEGKHLEITVSSAQKAILSYKSQRSEKTYSKALETIRKIDKEETREVLLKEIEDEYLEYTSTNAKEAFERYSQTGLEEDYQEALKLIALVSDEELFEEYRCQLAHEHLNKIGQKVLEISNR
ncbi:MAG: hypothetical protein K6F97_03230 [Lachnospiraceae bacterium]|nr:hypothetical protein [Lachnospiraceae bacterium]